jgi:NADP-dependent alcohol dehydrogenase
MPATGSEMNSGAVITRAETKEKRVMGGPGLFPQFSVLDPTVVATIPRRQLQNGIIDSFVHVLEQYVTYIHPAKLQDRFAEGILQTIVETAPKILENPADYDTAANYMWCCTMALNGLIQKGVPTDWATHMIGHELTALHNIDHARTLAIIGPQVYRFQFEGKKEKLAQYGKRVWGINADSVEVAAEAAIQKTEEFYKSLGVAIKLSDYTAEYGETAQIVFNRFEERGWNTMGERNNIGPEQAKHIVEQSIK